MKYIVSILLMFAFATCEAAPPSQSTCTPKKDDAAERVIDNVKDWSSLYHVYSHFEDCDNGGTAERVSDVVARLLSTHWSLLGQFISIANEHRGFEEFVVNHVNSTTSDDDLTKIIQNASVACPKDADAYCLRIGEKAKKAMDEASKVIG